MRTERRAGGLPAGAHWRARICRRRPRVAGAGALRAPDGGRAGDRGGHHVAARGQPHRRCDEDAAADKRNEEEFHTELRKEAAARNQLITSHSTNPEWNLELFNDRTKRFSKEKC